MGGIGSGRRRTRSWCTDECAALHIDDVIECGVLDGDVDQQHAMIVIRGEELWSGVVVMARRVGPHVYLALRYQSVPEASEDDSSESVTLVVIAEQSNKRRCHQGWAFYCPREIGERRCNSVATALYLPPGTEELGCRHCHQLAYSSTRQRNGRVSAYYHNPERLMGDFGRAIFDMKMGREDPRHLAVVCEALGGLRNANSDLTFLCQP